MALQIITTVAKARLVSYKDEFLTAHPNTETIDNLEFDKDKIEDESNLRKLPKYTDSQWLDEVVLRWVKRQLQIGDARIKDVALIKKEFDMETE